MPMDIAASCAKHDSNLSGKQQVDSAKRRVLVIGDMQKDYDTSANVELYGSVQCPYANDISTFVPVINRVRKAANWDRVVFTQDWLSAKQLAGRTAFCLEESLGAGLLDGLAVDHSSDIFFKKNNDDSFCNEGGTPEANTGCSRLGDVLSSLGFLPGNTALYFVGQRFERCILKTVMHAASLGYESIVLNEATYCKEDEPDVEWPLSVGPVQAADVYLARKSAGRRLAESYMLGAGVRVVESLDSLKS
eukprot:TRINITY_DN34216_c0_g1_i1.p1 TRINITY_DN34216_c0_g1~~TRINITY_DN34216_c0_g1_i1.p1  ORF type:complete len:248 (+),score=24.05 TRINITY_DN34216_c0_g1_i1:72-815(+)